MIWPFKCKTENPIDRDDRWYVLLDGVIVAMLDNPQDADMFWFTWEVHEIDGVEIPSDLWDYSRDKDRSFQHVETGEKDSYAFPAGNPLAEPGRIHIRGPLRGRDDEQKVPPDEPET